jgi:putative DNA-invertase from lambdoid prophage Rac
MGTTLRAALYSRVSTTDQNAKRQVDEMRAFVKARKWTVAAEETDAMSGSKDRRPGLDRVMKMARARKCDVIVVQALDRFARSIRHFVLTVAELEALGVAFVSTSQGFDMTTPMGKFAMTILASVAELEREMIRERVRSGMARAKREGKRIGRPVTAISPLKLRRLRDAKTSIWGMSRHFKVSRTAIRTALKSLD